MSARLFTQYPVHASVSENSGDSIVDTHLLMKDHLLFIVGIKLDVQRNLYDAEVPKYPLEVDVSVSHVGNSSSRRHYRLFQSGMRNQELLNCVIDDVIVSKSTRKAAMFPSWWLEKYDHLRLPKERLVLPEPATRDNIFSDEFLVDFEHTDHNKHTTTAAYIRFCFNAAFRHIQKSDYKNVTEEHFGTGTKSLTVLFFKESSLGKKLIVQSWESGPGILNFQIRNEKYDLCCSVMVDFHKSDCKSAKARM